MFCDSFFLISDILIYYHFFFLTCSLLLFAPVSDGFRSPGESCNKKRLQFSVIYKSINKPEVTSRPHCRSLQDGPLYGPETGLERDTVSETRKCLDLTLRCSSLIFDCGTGCYSILISCFYFFKNAALYFVSFLTLKTELHLK